MRTSGLSYINDCSLDATSEAVEKYVKKEAHPALIPIPLF